MIGGPFVLIVLFDLIRSRRQLLSIYFRMAIAFAAIFKGEHLFVNDIAGRANGADEKFGGFEKRRTYFFESGSVEKNARLFFDPLPFFNLTGKNVLHPGETLIFCRHK